MLNEHDPRGTVIPLESRKYNTTESSGSQELNPTKGVFGRVVDRYHTFTKYLKQSPAGQDILFPLHELFQSLKNPGRILKNAGRYAPNIGFAAAEVFALGSAAIAVASAAEIQSESQPDLTLKEIKGVDKDGKMVEFIQFYDGRGTSVDKDSKPVIVYQIFPQGWENDRAGLKAAKQAFLDGFLQTPVFKDYAGRFLFLYRRQNTLENLEVRPNGIIDNADGLYRELDRSIFALAPIMPIPVHTMAFTKSSNGLPSGHSDPVFTRLDQPASPLAIGSTVYPETDNPTKSANKVVAHETLLTMGVEVPRTPEEYNSSITGIGFDFLPRDEVFVRRNFDANGGNYSARYQYPEFKTYNTPKVGYLLNSVTNYVGVNIPVDLPYVTTQYRFSAYPSISSTTGKSDGPAIEMIIGDRRQVADVIQNRRIFIPAPNTNDKTNFTLLPDTYTYQLCVSANPTSVAWLPLQGWETPISIWPNGLTVTNKCKEGTFNTRDAQRPTADTIHPVGYDSATNSLIWRNDDPTIFYYEVQVSGDNRFDNNPETATSFVWENLVHGGVTENSWKMPAVQPGAKLFWRVRPRIQGQGAPVAWGETWSVTAK